MKKIALIIALLGLNLAIANENIATNDELNDDNAEYLYEDDDSDEIVDNNENINNEDIDVNSDAKEYSKDNNDKQEDFRDITRWQYTQEELINKEEKAAKKAKREEEYKKSITRKRSGMFVGGGIGASNADLSVTTTTQQSASMNGLGLGVDLFVGYQKAFNDYSGLRTYVEVADSFGTGVFYAKTQDGTTYKADSNLLKGIANIDVYLEGSMGRNNSETLGVFLGLGVAYMRYNGNDNIQSFNAVSLVMNGGIHTIIANNHRIELLVRWHPFIKADKAANGNATFIGNMESFVRYSYMF
ncbi:hypothetical protein [Helicobacter sp. MIT 14-3879]|uniref:hypothetical protein n=1 Tax=Helicobacter sp. MIT 14-3879 TaxID=2040649 RepID=UPI000E1F6B5D|nr:hypothetical protein [Helicobacter sp. MIT 14-3879]RDU65663.1 hypothetical protein CQA44_01390 [Helicobacter sp. MIT 14-3879]